MTITTFLLLIIAGAVVGCPGCQGIVHIRKALTIRRSYLNASAKVSIWNKTGKFCLLLAVTMQKNATFSADFA